VGRWYGSLKMMSRDPDKTIRIETDLAHFETGLLSPDGHFYPCEWGEHGTLAMELGFSCSGEAALAGWMRCADCEFYDFPQGGWLSSKVPAPTRNQIRAVEDWVLAAPGRYLPSWLEEIR